VLVFCFGRALAHVLGVCVRVCVRPRLCPLPLQLCDFGNTIPFHELPEYKGTPYMQTPYYRAPEVILGYARTCAVDVWSAGCVLFEIFTGAFCFTGACNRDILWSMQDALGPVPGRLLRRAQFRDSHYGPTSDALLPRAPPPAPVAPVAAPGAAPGGQGAAPGVPPPPAASRPLDVPDIRSRLLNAAAKGLVRAVKAKHPTNKVKIADAKRRGLSDLERTEVLQLYDLLAHILVYDVDKRLTAEQVLRHEFFRDQGR
jgi:serine/threonine protein kinase